MTDVGEKVESDDADPACGERIIEFFGDELADLGLVGALHFQHLLDDATHATLGLVGHVRVPDDEAVELVEVLFEFLHIIIAHHTNLYNYHSTPYPSFVLVAVPRLVYPLRRNTVLVAKLEDVLRLPLHTHLPARLKFAHERVHIVVLDYSTDTEGKGKSG